MDRYQILRQDEFRVLIPSEGDIEKYGEYGEETKKNQLMSKAELCAKIAKLEHPTYSDQDLVKVAVMYMHLSDEELNSILHASVR